MVPSGAPAAPAAASSSSTERPVPDWALPPDLSSLLIFGWLWHDGRSIDENLMDLAYMLARNSTCKDGHMGCLMVRGVCAGRGGERGSPEALGIAGAVPVTPTAPPSCAPAPGDPVRPSVVVTAINAPMFGAHRSDVHAEALAVSECARRGIATAGLSCYVTRAPCLSCYKILATAGVRRIVCPQSALPSDDCATSAGYYGIEYVWVPDRPERAEERNARAAANTDYARVRELREERKRQRREGKNANSGRKAACAGHEAGAEGASSAGGGQEGES